MARVAAGGALMGLANLVPGVSGGTMLLAAGVYPLCIGAIAQLTTLRPDRTSVAILAAVAASGGLVILFLAGTMRGLVLEHRWAMYSLFLGSTLGGVPPLWRLIGRSSPKAWLGCAAGLAAMVAGTVLPGGPTGEVATQAVVLFVVGVGAFAAMILPGLSGGYLLVLTGQYVPVLGAVDAFKSAILGSEPARWPALLDSLQVLAPFAVGGVAALVGVSRLIRFLLRRHRALMLGFLLGLLLGAVLGLWPFGTNEPGLAVPSFQHALAALGLLLCGFVATSAIARVGPAEKIP